LAELEPQYDATPAHKIRVLILKFYIKKRYLKIAATQTVFFLLFTIEIFTFHRYLKVEGRNQGWNRIRIKLFTRRRSRIRMNMMRLYNTCSKALPVLIFFILPS
jgi:hypothetical protein